jgi:hypothetical protein
VVAVTETPSLSILDRLDLLDRFDAAILVRDMVAFEMTRGPAEATGRHTFETWAIDALCPSRMRWIMELSRIHVFTTS